MFDPVVTGNPAEDRYDVTNLEDSPDIYLHGRNGITRLEHRYSFAYWKYRKWNGLKQRRFSWWIKIGLVGGALSGLSLVQLVRFIMEIVS